jgi:formate--tetrahydrofolate ligase
MTNKLLPIDEVAEKLGLLPDEYEIMGAYGAKLKLDLLANPAFPARGKLILVTATTPTTSGEGKTVVSIGLAQGLERIGCKAIVTSREPSLGPVFGMKGGAAGGGLSQVEPSQKINLHFHGDFHAITAAHNLLAAMIDTHLFFGNALDLDPAQVSWPRAMDMNDRALRRIEVGIGSKGDGANRATGFVITAASEIMAILALASSRADLRRRLEAIVVGVSRAGRPVTAGDLGVTGAMMALLSEALLPNLVQTTEGTPALVHTGPFGNIAHGTSSVLSHQMGIHLADYVVNEAGFAADLGAEKYFDIVMGVSGIRPAAAVLVATVQSLRAQGEGNLEAGFANLDHHVQTLRGYGVPIVVAINHFPAGRRRELDAIAAECERLGVSCAVTEAFSKGGLGSTDLAEKVIGLIEAHPTPDVRALYALDDSLETKLHTVATGVYGAEGVSLSAAARAKLERYTEWGFGRLPVCVAKTQYSLTDDPKRMGAPKGWMLNVQDALLSAGAGFVVAVSGNMMLMPGLPHASRALSIDVDDEGNITGV